MSAALTPYMWSNIDNVTFTPLNYERAYLYPRHLYDLKKNKDDASFFLSLCSTPERAALECPGWNDNDMQKLRAAQAKVSEFQGVLHSYFDFAIQMIFVAYIWGAGLYLLWKRHFDLHWGEDPHRFNPTKGMKWFLNFQTAFTAEEIKTVVVTDSEEEEEIFNGVDLSDCISESDEEERRMRRADPNEYGRLESRKIRHEDELTNPKYKNQRVIKRRKKVLANVNNNMNGTTVRNLRPPPSAGKKFDSYGTPKYPRIYEIRRMVNQPNRFLARL